MCSEFEGLTEGQHKCALHGSPGRGGKGAGAHRGSFTFMKVAYGGVSFNSSFSILIFVCKVMDCAKQWPSQ